MLLVFLVLLIGTIGYIVIEDLNVLDSLYMTVITIFTVGFREMKQPLSAAGQLFTIFIILSGVGTAILGFTKLAEIAFGGGFYAFWRRRAMQRQLETIKDHFIICGHGRMGRIVRKQLESERLPFVIIDKDPKKIEDLDQSPHCLYIEGDAGHEDIVFNPQPNVDIEAGDTLLVMGHLSDIQQFEKTYIRAAS